MDGIDAHGCKVTVEKSGGRRKPPGYFSKLGLSQARGKLALVLLADGIAPSEAAKILRTNRTSLYRDADAARQIQPED